jgi:hypothetical protein
MASNRPSRSAIAVALLGLVLTAALGVHVLNKPGVFYSATSVGFHPPPSAANPNNSFVSSGSITSTAGAVGRMVEPNPPIGQVVSPTVTLVDEGVRHGWSVTLPNDGGQFTNHFDVSLLTVQAVGSSAAEVRTTIEQLVVRINVALKTLQDQANVPANDRISTTENPPRTQVYYFGNSRPRALAAVLVLGLAVTLTAEMILSRWQNRRRRSHAAAHPSGLPA